MNTKKETMTKFGFLDADEFDTLLLDLGINIDSDEISEEGFEKIKQHVLMFATALPSLPSYDSGEPTDGAMTHLTAQGLAAGRETGLSLTQGALETLCQMTFDKGTLDAVYLENAYWLGLMRQRNQLHAENAAKFLDLLAQEQSQEVNLELLATESGLQSNEVTVKNLTAVAATAIAKSSAQRKTAIAQSLNW